MPRATPTGPKQPRAPRRKPAASDTPKGRAANAADPLFANNPQPMWVFDRESLRFLDVNRAAETIYGWTRQEFLAMTLAEIRPAEDGDRVRAVVRERRPGLQAAGIWTHRRKDGRRITVEIVSHDFEHSGRPAVLVMARDVTERQLAADSLLRSQQLLAEAQSLAHIGSWNWDIAANVVTWSDELFRICGLEPQSVPVNYESFLARVHPDDRARVDGVVRAAFASGERFGYSARMVRADGDVRWIAATGRAEIEAGLAVRMHGTAQDITTQRRREILSAIRYDVTRVLAEAATADEARPRLLAAICGGLGWDFGAIWSPLPGESFLACDEIWRAPGAAAASFEDACRTTRFRAGIGLPGRVWASRQPAFISDVTRDANFPRAAKAATSGLHSAFAFPFFRQREVAGIAEFFSEEMLPPDDELLATMGDIGRQVSLFVERCDAQERLEALRDASRKRRQMEEIGALIGGVAHEVRNPLFNISSTFDAFEQRFKDRDEYHRYVAVLREQVGRLKRLMDELLDYGRPFELRLSPVAWDDVLAEALRTVEPLAESRNVTVRIAPSATAIEVTVDRPRVVVVLANLLDNAVRFSLAASTVELSTRRENGELAVTIDDAGPGIPAADLDRIFEPFFSHRSGGTGLGLAIVRRIVEAHGGTVAASNRADGGARFEVRFPAIVRA